MKRREFLLQTGIVTPLIWVFGCSKGHDSPIAAGGGAGTGGATTEPVVLDDGSGVPLERSLIRGWRFVLNDAGEGASAKVFDDSDWLHAALPHTARIEALVTGAPGKDTYQWQGICWYRQLLVTPEECAERRVYLKFEAAMNVADVWFDGTWLGQHLGGYLPFVFDISDLVKPGQEQVLAVRLNNKDNATTGPKPLSQLDFNTYHGLYRDVRLMVKGRLYITDSILANRPASGGVFVTFPEVDDDQAVVSVQTHVRNDDAAERNLTVRVTLLDSSDRQVTSEESTETALQPNSDVDIVVSLNVDNPALWSPKHPSLYLLRVEIVSDKRVIDVETVRIGIRRIEISSTGFRINGEPMFLRGTNRHQEYPYVGYALSAAAQYRDAKKIKDAGFDYVRLSHYVHAPEFMDACDELGLVVMNCIPGWQYYSAAETFQTVQFDNCRRMIRRDRNHPCVILWEVSLNESAMPTAFVLETQRIAHEEYPGDQCYTAGWKNGYDVFLQARQHGGCKSITDRPCVVSEAGDWEYYANNAGLNQDGWANLTANEANSRQLRSDGEKAMLQQATNFQEAHNDNLSTIAFADGLWVMFDYNRGYATDLAACGCMDIFRLPKYSYFLFQSQRDSTEDYVASSSGPMVFIASQWTATSSLNVRVFSNCEEVELFLNGVSAGRKSPDTDRLSTNLAHPPTTFSVAAFAAGSLVAVAYVAGTEAARHEVRTPSTVSQLVLSLDEGGKPFAESEKDVVFVHGALQDSAGTLVTDAWENVTFGAMGSVAFAGQNPFSTIGGIASIVLVAEVRAPKAAVYGLCVLPDADRFRVLAASLNVGAAPSAFEIRVTTDGSAPLKSSPIYTDTVACDRLRAALLVGGEIIAEADSSTARFRVPG